ncbi:MAG: twin-arginine translocation signal domain-containing protein, partial [Acidobacteriaceae bacterium]|nr:twin-arginine translocation signal domain-containing protein [Acidobacteriaceae bacterium]
MPVESVNLSGLSRRSFLRLATTASAMAAVPILTEGHLAEAQRSKVSYSVPPPDAVRIDANENPLGPCAGACALISSLVPEGGRYRDDLTVQFIDAFCATEGLKSDYILPYAGSSEPLHYTVLAFTSKDKPYVTADPGYEAGM